MTLPPAQLQSSSNLSTGRVISIISLGLIICGAALVMQLARSGSEYVPYVRYVVTVDGPGLSADPITESHLDAVQAVLEQYGQRCKRTGPLTLLIPRSLANDKDLLMNFCDKAEWAEQGKAGR